MGYTPKSWACVLGGAGFIGSNLVDELVANGYGVKVLDNFSEGRVENLSRWVSDSDLLIGQQSGPVRVVRGDIRNIDEVRAAVEGCSVAFHLAAMSRIQPSITDPLLAFSQNVMGTANVAQACAEAGVKRLVYSASSSAYGLLIQDPTQPATEDMPTDCLNPYSLSKKTGEEIMELYAKLYGLSTVSLRYFNVYGPRHQEEGSYATVIAIFRKQLRQGRKMTIVGDGEQRRDFTFVGDVVRANMMASMNRDVGGVINIGCGRNYSINEVAALVGGLDPLRTDSPEFAEAVEYIPPRQGEARFTLAGNRKAAELLGWRPAVTLEQGLQVLDRYEQINGAPSGYRLYVGDEAAAEAQKLGLIK